MHHEEHASPETTTRSSQTNGAGLLLLAIVATLIAIFCWKMWIGASKEAEHYRFSQETAMAGHEGHEGSTGGETHTENLLDPAAIGTLDTATGNFIRHVGDLVKITLNDANKTVLTVGANSTEAKLFHFLSDENTHVDEVDKTQGWITCDRIFFETGKAELTPESKQQISNIATILKAFPEAELKVGGYTDNTGSADINTKVSDERAATVKDAIVAEGAANAAASEGYGPLHPIASNDTPEGRALNRRTDLRVTKK